ncbi:hypothetical protein ONZ45_g9457 [Pleurotus djamor]|nr:hypothetical protein ONZ45_g9457 [Pleurotus djamor]
MATTTESQTSTIPMPNGTQTPPPEAAAAAPEITFLNRMVSIPLVSSSLQTINDALAANAYLKSPYSTAKDLSASAYKYTEPLQVRLAPLIVRADGYANKAVDIVEAKYPYPFHAKPEEVATLVRESRDNAVTLANKNFDEKVKSPALNVAQGIDNTLAPIVDYLEAYLNSSPNAGPSSPPDSKYQYQRAIALSKTLKDRAYIYSGDQIKHIQTHSALVNTAMGTAQSISDLTTSSLATAQERVHALSNTMLAELQKVQTSAHALSASLSTTASDLQAAIRSQASQIPPQFHEQLAQFQKHFNESNATLNAAVVELKEIVAADVPLQDKVIKITSEVKGRVTPLLAALQESIAAVLPGTAKAPAEEAPSDASAPAQE